MPDWLNKMLGLPVSSSSDLGPEGAAKGLTVTHEPGGFVTEVRGMNAPRRYGVNTSGLAGTLTANELVFACIGVRATSAQDPRLVVQTRQRDGSYKETADHPFRQLIMRPNPDMTESDLMRAAVVSWDITNPRRFYCEKEYDRGVLVGLHPLNPLEVKPLPSRTDSTKMIGYVWSDGSSRKEYTFEEILVRRAPVWSDPPPLPAALGAIESDSEQTEFVRSFFANGGIPPGILKFNRPLNDGQREEIRGKWAAAYGNRYSKSHNVGVLDVSAEYQKTGANLDELASQTLRSVAESRICMVFGVPPLIVYAYVGLLRATYANLGDAWAGFWDATMSPLFRDWRMFWLWGLLPEFEEERVIRSEAVRLHYDMSQVSAMQEDVDAAQDRARNNFAAGGISLNEFRAQIGAAPVPGGDLLYATARPLAPLPIAGAEPAPVDTAPKSRERKDRAAPGVQALERRLEQWTRQYLEREYARAAEAIEAGA